MGIKIALDEVKNFNEKTPVVFTYVKRIKKAADSLQEESKLRLLKLLRHKVKDNTSDTIKGINFDSITEYTHHFERLVGKNVCHLDLLNKLGSIYQIKNESFLSYQLCMSIILVF